MSDRNMTDVLIVGAGPVGLTLAVDLARRGVSCRVIEQDSSYHVGSRARGLTPRTMEVFDDLGIVKEIQARGNANRGVRFYNRENQLIHEISRPTGPVPPDVPYRNIILSQQETEAVLRERLSTFGVSVELDCQFVDFVQNEDRVVSSVLRAGRAEEIRSRYLVGCDGGSSMVRKKAGISFEGETTEDQRLFLGNVKVSGLEPDAMYQWVDPKFGLLLVLDPLSKDGDWWFGAGLSPHEDRSISPTLETLQRLFDKRIGLPGIHFSEADQPWISVYRANVRMADSYRRGCVFLAGDAAHVHSPAGGQGMQTGIQDAYNLGWKLASVLSGAPDRLLDTYQSERLPIAQEVLKSTSARGQAFARTNSLIDSISRVFAGKDRFADTTQLSVNYRGGPLARDRDEAIGLRAGDRAPDAPGLHATNGEPVRLFDLFRGPHFTLLAFSDQPVLSQLTPYQDLVHGYTVLPQGSERASNGHSFIDSEGHAYRVYGVTGQALLLVRPDGYIGLTAGALDPQPVIDYLRDLLG